MGHHDALFKWVFSSPLHAAGALRVCLPEPLSLAIEWSQLRLCPGSFVDEQLRERHTDLLFSAPWSGQTGLLYVLYEHQSSPDPWMPLRLLRYMVRIWETTLRQYPERKTLPPIVPVVLSPNDFAWKSSRFIDAFDVPADLRVSLAPYIPSFQFVLDDLGQVSDIALRTRAMSALGRLALASLKYGRRDEGSMHWLQTWGEVVKDVERAPQGRDALALVMRYLSLVNERVKPLQLQRVLAGPLGSEVAKEIMMTHGEKLIERGRRRGEAKGRAQTLLRLLAQRGLAVSDAQRQHILGCLDLATLDRWADQVLTVSSTDALVAP